jgi:hypothetical protein
MSGLRPLLESKKELEEAHAAVKVSWSVLLYEELCRSHAHNVGRGQSEADMPLAFFASSLH